MFSVACEPWSISPLHRDGEGRAPSRPASATARLSIGSRPGLKIDDRPRGAAVEFAPLQGGDQPRPGQRRLAAARGAQDRQEAVLLARGRGPQRDDQPLGQRLAAEEERGVLDVEDLQAAVGARALEGRAAGAGARLDRPGCRRPAGGTPPRRRASGGTRPRSSRSGTSAACPARAARPPAGARG